MYKVLALIGKAGSGKDTLLRALCQLEPQLNEIISCTTRPKREGEEDGVNYHFLTTEDFSQKVLCGEMIEATFFNNWAYGTPITSLDQDKWNVGVFNPEGINILSDYFDINLQVIYIQANEKTRLLRQLNREENPNVKEIIRRFSTDEVDFEQIEVKYNIYYNESDTDIKQLAQAILDDIN